MCRQAVSGGGGLTKRGAGLLILGNNNSYAGVTTVNSGILEITDNQALGSTAAGTTVKGGATLLLSFSVFHRQRAAHALRHGLRGEGALDLVDLTSNQVTWAGTITLAGGAAIGNHGKFHGHFRLDCVIQGSGI